MELFTNEYKNYLNLWGTAVRAEQAALPLLGQLREIVLSYLKPTRNDFAGVLFVDNLAVANRREGWCVAFNPRTGLALIIYVGNRRRHSYATPVTLKELDDLPSLVERLNKKRAYNQREVYLYDLDEILVSHFSRVDSTFVNHV